MKPLLFLLRKLGPGGIPAGPALRQNANPPTGSAFFDIVAESGAAADSPDATAVVSDTVAESGAAADAPVAVVVDVDGVAESGSASDTVAGSDNEVASVIAEAGTAVDTTDATVVFAALRNEPPGQSTDSLTITVVDNPSLAESGAASDTPAATVVDTPSVTESGSASDAVAGSDNEVVSALTESGTAVDAVAVTAIIAPALAEAGAASDTSNATVVDNPSLAESGAASDKVDYSNPVIESGAAADTVNVTAVTRPSLAEAGAAADAPSAATTFAVAVSESGAASDAVVGNDNEATAVLAEAGTAVDASTVHAIVAATVAESGSASDAVHDVSVISALADVLSAQDSVAIATPNTGHTFAFWFGGKKKKRDPYWAAWKVIPDWLRPTDPVTASVLQQAVPKRGVESVVTVRLTAQAAMAEVPERAVIELTAALPQPRLLALCVDDTPAPSGVIALATMPVYFTAAEPARSYAFARPVFRAIVAPIHPKSAQVSFTGFRHSLDWQWADGGQSGAEVCLNIGCPTRRTASQTRSRGKAGAASARALAVQAGRQRSLTAARRDLRKQITEDHPTWPARVVEAEVADAERGRGSYATLARELRFRTLKVLREVDPRLRQRAGASRKMIRFDKLLRKMSDEYGPRVAASWTRAVTGWRKGLDMRALRRALQRRDAQEVARIVKAARAQQLVEQGVAKSLADAMRASGKEGAQVLTSRGYAMQFNAAHPAVAAAARRQAAALVKDTPAQTRQVIAEIIAMGQEYGLTVDQQARAIREVITLPPNWASAPVRLAEDIRRGRMGRINSRYLSAVDQQKIRSRIQNDTVTESFVEEMQATYAKRLENLRAQTIARQETQTAVHEALMESWRQGERDGVLPPTMRKFWLVTADERLCPICRAIPRLNPKGRKLDEPFATPQGPRMYPPMAHVKCRCAMGLAFAATWRQQSA